MTSPVKMYKSNMKDLGTAGNKRNRNKPRARIDNQMSLNANQIVGRKRRRSANITKNNQPRRAAETVWKKTLIPKMTK